jgi:hypothetical protein
VTITSDNYVQHVLRTDSPITPDLLARLQDPQTVRLLHAAIGLATESGELLDMLKKHIFYGRPLDRVNAREEVGDSQWYAGLAIDVLSSTMDEILTMNIDKLRLRYPEKFCESRAVDRDTVAERRLLEGCGPGGACAGDCGCSQEEVHGVSTVWLEPAEPPSPSVTERTSDDELDRAGATLTLYATTRRGANWLIFAAIVLRHVEGYTVPQYGDEGEDQVSEWTAADCVTAIRKYAARFGRNTRDGQDRLDLLKIAHFASMAAEKL